MDDDLLEQARKMVAESEPDDDLLAQARKMLENEEPSSSSLEGYARRTADQIYESKFTTRSGRPMTPQDAKPYAGYLNDPDWVQRPDPGAEKVGEFLNKHLSFQNLKQIYEAQNPGKRFSDPDFRRLVSERYMQRSMERARASEKHTVEKALDYVGDRLPFAGHADIQTTAQRAAQAQRRLKAGTASQADLNTLVEAERAADRAKTAGIGEKFVDSVTALPGFLVEAGSTGLAGSVVLGGGSRFVENIGSGVSAAEAGKRLGVEALTAGAFKVAGGAPGLTGQGFARGTVRGTLAMEAAEEAGYRLNWAEHGSTITRLAKNDPKALEDLLVKVATIGTAEGVSAVAGRVIDRFGALRSQGIDPAGPAGQRVVEQTIREVQNEQPPPKPPETPVKAPGIASADVSPPTVAESVPVGKSAAGAVLERPVGGGKPPGSGLAVANVGADGKVYYGEPGEIHAQISERYPHDIRGDWKEVGFADKTGKFMTREEALNSVEAKNIKPSPGMEGQLDAMDYREQKHKVPVPPEPPKALPEVPATQEGITGARKAMMDADAAGFGLGDLPPAERITWAQSLAKARELGYPEKALDIASSVLANPREISDSETAGLTQRAAEIKLRHRQLEQERHSLTDEADKQTNRAERLRLIQDFSLLRQAIRGSKSISARNLASTKMALDPQMDLVSVLSDAGEIKTKSLTEGERQYFTDQVARLEADKQKLTVQNAELQKQKTIPPAKRVGFAEKIVLHLEKNAEESRKALQGMKGRVFSGVDPEPIIHLANIAAAKIARKGYDLAKFTAEMVADFGDGIKPYLQGAWDKARGLVAEQGPRKKIIDRAIAAEKNASNLGSVARKLAREFVGEGVSERNELVDAVHKELQVVDPAITRDQTMDAISGYGDYKPLSKDEVSVTLRDLKGQLQQIGKLRDLEQRLLPLKTGIERRTPTTEESALIKEVNDLKKSLGVKDVDLEVKKIDRQIAVLEKQIETGDIYPHPPGEKAPPPAEIQVKIDELNALRQQKQDMRAADTPRILAEREKHLQGRVEDLQERLDTGDVAPKGKAPQPTNKAIQELEYQIARRERAIRQKQQDLQPKSFARKLWEGTGILRLLQTTGEASFIARQGGLRLASAIGSLPLGKAKPAVEFASAVGDSFKAFFSDRYTHSHEQRMEARGNRRLYDRDGVRITDSDSRLTATEEVFVTNVFGKIPYIGKAIDFADRHTLGRFNRAGRVFLNEIRADAYDAMAATVARNGEPTAVEGKAIANFVNEVTGSGGLPGGDRAAAVLNEVFFSARYLSSRFQMLAGHSMWGGTAGTRKAIAAEYAKIAIGLGVMYGLGKLAGGTIEEDPRSSDFGKIKFGFSRLDPLSGLAQITTFGSRVATGSKQNFKGETVPLRGKVPYGGDTTTDIMGRFLRTKLAPNLSLAIDALEGKNVIGEDVDLADIKGDASRFVPITYRDIKEAMEVQGVPKGSALGLLAFMGQGLQTYGQPTPDSLGKASKSFTAPAPDRQPNESVEQFIERQRKHDSSVNWAKEHLREGGMTGDKLKTMMIDAERASGKVPRAYNDRGELTAFGRRLQKAGLLD